jgi:hypothetical protein
MDFRTSTGQWSTQTESRSEGFGERSRDSLICRLIEEDTVAQAETMEMGRAADAETAAIDSSRRLLCHSIFALRRWRTVAVYIDCLLTYQSDQKFVFIDCVLVHPKTVSPVAHRTTADWTARYPCHRVHRRRIGAASL